MDEKWHHLSAAQMVMWGVFLHVKPLNPVTCLSVANTHVHHNLQGINSGLYMLYGASPDMQVSDSNTIPQVLQLWPSWTYRSHMLSSSRALPLLVTSRLRLDLHRVANKAYSICNFSDLLKATTELTILVWLTRVRFSAFTLEGMGKDRRPGNDSKKSVHQYHTLDTLQDCRLTTYLL